MHTQIVKGQSKVETYELMLKQAEVLIDNRCDYITNLANLSALIYYSLENLNWAGFYLLKGDSLHLGPFQGEVACTIIGVGQGVCGTAVKSKETIVVPNVHEFPGHIACSSASNSEIVVPIFIGSNIYGVIDLDSTAFNNFDETDKKYLEQLANLITTKIL
jgi:GAF domain-containing protein